MALLDLSHVTNSVTRLIRESFRFSAAWNAGNPPDVLSEPPNRFNGEGLCFYLYHVQENASYKNLPSPGNDHPPVRFTPLALNLYYQLTANSAVDNEPALQEQLMMGIAMKTLHDYPEINDNTFVGTTQVLQTEIRGSDNRFKITLIPIAHDAAVQNWTAGAAAMKLSAYYLVTVVLFTPEPITTYSGRVLTYGTAVFADNVPRITGTENRINFTIPGRATAEDVQVQPAQVSQGSRMSFFGSGFNGDLVELFIYNDRWAEPGLVDAAWAVTFNERLVTTVVQPTIPMPQPNNANNTEFMVPGIYSGQIQVLRRITLSNGQLRQVRRISNRFPFTIMPLVNGVSVPKPNGDFSVQGEFFLNAPNNVPVDINVYVGEDLLTETNAAPNPGEFVTVATNQIDACLPAGLPTGQILPVRVLINAIESPPFWITAP